jgi:hypothetical protein
MFEHVGIVSPFGSIEDFDADDATFGIVVHDDAVGDLRAVLDRTVGQVEVDRVRLTVDSHAHGLVLPQTRQTCAVSENRLASWSWIPGSPAFALRATAGAPE